MVRLVSRVDLAIVSAKVVLQLPLIPLVQSIWHRSTRARGTGERIATVLGQQEEAAIGDRSPTDQMGADDRNRTRNLRFTNSTEGVLWHPAASCPYLVGARIVPSDPRPPRPVRPRLQYGLQYSDQEAPVRYSSIRGHARRRTAASVRHSDTTDACASQTVPDGLARDDASVARAGPALCPGVG
jgi:hypothetical protein